MSTIASRIRSIIQNDPALTQALRQSITSRSRPFLVTWDRKGKGLSYKAYEKLVEFISRLHGVRPVNPVSQLRLMYWGGTAAELNGFIHSTMVIYHSLYASSWSHGLLKRMLVLELPLHAGAVSTFSDGLSAVEAARYLPNARLGIERM